MKHVRQQAAAKDKQLDLAHRTIQRIAVDKNGLEVDDAAKKSYIRQLESRVAGMKSSADLYQLCAELQVEIQSLKDAMQYAEEKASIAEQASVQHQGEAEFLRRGIQLAAEQLARSTGTDITAAMLMSVAQGQSEAIELSSQLAEYQAQIDEMASALTAARSHLQMQHDALQQWQEWETSQTKQASEREASLKAEKRAAKELRLLVDALQGAVDESKREQEAALHRLELERTARQDSEAKVITLQAALRCSEQNECALRAEIQRLAAVERSHVAELQRVQAASQALAAENASLQKKLQHKEKKTHAALPLPELTRRPSGSSSLLSPRQPPASSPLARYTPPGHQKRNRIALNDSISALEAELAQLAAHPALVRPPGPATAAAVVARLPQESLLLSPQQQRIVEEAGGMWHINPVASPDKPPRPQSHHRQQQQAEQQAVAPSPAAARPDYSPAQSLSENAAWRVLEQGLDQQREEDKKMTTLWAPDGHNAVPGHDDECSSETSSSGGDGGGGREFEDLRVEVPGGGSGENISFSPAGIPNTNTQGGLQSPDLGQFSARASTDWLNVSVGDGFRELEGAAAKHRGEKESGGATGSAAKTIAVNAFAGLMPAAAAPVAPTEDAKEKRGNTRSVRQSLFDIARMEMNY